MKNQKIEKSKIEQPIVHSAGAPSPKLPLAYLMLEVSEYFLLDGSSLMENWDDHGMDAETEPDKVVAEFYWTDFEGEKREESFTAAELRNATVKGNVVTIGDNVIRCYKLTPVNLDTDARAYS